MEWIGVGTNGGSPGAVAPLSAISSRSTSFGFFSKLIDK
jgi:hypothetical protein